MNTTPDNTTTDERRAGDGPDMDMIEPDQEHTIYRIERWVEPGDKHVYAVENDWSYTGELSSDKDRAITKRDEMAEKNPQYTYRVVSETTSVTYAVVR